MVNYFAPEFFQHSLKVTDFVFLGFGFGLELSRNESSKLDADVNDANADDLLALRRSTLLSVGRF